MLGGLRLANREPLTRELRSLEKDSALLKNIINDLEYSMNMDSSNTYEKFLTGFYSSHKTGYPNVAPVQGYVLGDCSMKITIWELTLQQKTLMKFGYPLMEK